MRDFLQQGIASSKQPLNQFIHLAPQSMVQQVIEQEVTDYLGRARYERQAEVNGYRNGYKPGRIRSAEPCRSRLLEFLRGSSDVLDYLVVQTYSRGLSTRDVEQANAPNWRSVFCCGRAASPFARLVIMTSSPCAPA